MGISPEFVLMFDGFRLKLNVNEFDGIASAAHV